MNSSENELSMSRFDGEKGFQRIVPTKMGFVEADGSDKRVRRLYLFNPKGKIEKVFLIDLMGVLFKDLPNIKNDFNYSGNFS